MDFYAAQARQAADTVFLKLSATVEDPGEMDAAEVRTFVMTCPETFSRALLEGVAEVCVAVGMPREHQIAAEMVTAEAYRTRLNLHFEQTSPGGTA